MLLQAYGHADDGELREDEVFRVKMKQEEKKILSSPLFLHLESLRSQSPSPTSLLFEKQQNDDGGGVNGGGEIASLCHCVCPYSLLPGCSDHSSSSSPSPRAPSHGLPPPFCQMFQWRSPPDGEEPSLAFSLVFPSPSFSLSLPPSLSLLPVEERHLPLHYILPLSVFLPFLLSVSLPFLPLPSLRRYMWAD